MRPGSPSPFIRPEAGEGRTASARRVRHGTVSFNWPGERSNCLWLDHDAPGRAADRQRLDDLFLLQIDHRYVAAHAVGGVKPCLVLPQRHVPDALADQIVFLHLEGRRVDLGDAVRRSQRHEGPLAVLRDPDPDGLDGVRRNAGDLEADLVDHLLLRSVDHADCAADLRRYPDLLAVGGEFGHARAAVHQDIADDLAGVGVDEVGHVGGFGSIHQQFAVRADAHAFRFNADFDLVQDLPGADIQHRHHVVVLVGDIQVLTVGVQRQQFRIGAGGQAVDHFAGGKVDHVDAVVVPDADIKPVHVLAQDDPARPAADFDGRLDF